MANFSLNFECIPFDIEYLLFADEMEELAGVYVVYTTKTVLDIGITRNLKFSIEEHKNTQEWLNIAGEEDIYVAFHFDENPESRKDKEIYLRSKISLPAY